MFPLTTDSRISLLRMNSSIERVWLGPCHDRRTFGKKNFILHNEVPDWQELFLDSRVSLYLSYTPRLSVTKSTTELGSKRTASWTIYIVASAYYWPRTVSPARRIAFSLFSPACRIDFLLDRATIAQIQHLISTLPNVLITL